MATSVNVNWAEVTATAGQVNGVAGEIETQLTALRGHIDSLGDWTGDAHAALEALYTQWSTSAQQLHEALLQIAVAMNTAATNYEQNELSTRALFS